MTDMRARNVDFSHWQRFLSREQLNVPVPIGTLKFNEGRKIYLDDELIDSLAAFDVREGYMYIRSNHQGYFPLTAQIDTYLEAVEMCKARGVTIDAHWVDFEQNVLYKSVQKRVKVGGKWVNRVVREALPPDNQFSMQFGNMTLVALQEIQKETKRLTGLYTSPRYYQEGLLQYGQKWMKDWPLWIAQWPFYGWDDRIANAHDPAAWNPRLPAGVVDWFKWQVTAWWPSDGAAGTPTLDMNVTNGTLAQYKAALGLADTPATPPDDGEDPAAQWNAALTAAGAAIEDLRR